MIPQGIPVVGEGKGKEHVVFVDDSFFHSSPLYGSSIWITYVRCGKLEFECKEEGEERRREVRSD